MRLGVERPEPGRLPPNMTTPAPSISGILSIVGDGEVRGVGLVDADDLSAECLGGDGGRVDEVCVGLVKRRETDAVAVDVSASAMGGGDKGKKAGCRRGSGCLGGGCSSRILRSALMVCLAGQPSEEDEDSSMGGVMHRCGEWGGLGV